MSHSTSPLLLTLPPRAQVLLLLSPAQSLALPLALLGQLRLGPLLEQMGLLGVGGGIGQRITQLGKRLGRVREQWVVGKQHAQPGPAIPEPRPLAGQNRGNRTPPSAARQGERAETSSSSSSQRGRSLSSKSSSEQAAPSPASPPTTIRRSCRPPDRYQAAPPPVTKKGKKRRN